MKYIFVASTGRCGTAYLAKLLNCAEGVVARHEPKPDMLGNPMREWNQGNFQPMRDLLPEKMEQIEKDRKGKIYAETSNAFIKGFGQELLEAKLINPENMALIHVERNNGLHNSLERANFGRDDYWSIYPTDKMSVVPQSYVGHRSFWYPEEIQTRADKFYERFGTSGKMKYVKADLDSLNSLGGVLNLFKMLGLKYKPDLPEVVGYRVNEGLTR